MALRQSIAQTSSEWEESLVLSRHRMKRAVETPTFETAHKTFHMTLLSNAASPISERYCSQLYDLNIRYRYLAASGADYQRRDISAEHIVILEAAVGRNADAASKAPLSQCRTQTPGIAAALEPADGGHRKHRCHAC
jgi:DNA-binding GntR family transcriptional regulator